LGDKADAIGFTPKERLGVAYCDNWMTLRTSG
jgi:hypothetical protein